MTDIERARLDCLNDQFRRNPTGSIPGCLLVTEGIVSLLGGDRSLEKELLHKLAKSDESFATNSQNDNHDFGSFTFQGHSCLWKIEYYSDSECVLRIKHPVETGTCYRVLTVMLEIEY